MKNDVEKKMNHIFERFMNGDMNRRDFIKYLGIAGAAAGLVGGPFSPFAKKAVAAKSIRFDGWGGVVSEAFREHAFKPFTKATGVGMGLTKVKRIIAEQNGEIQVQSSQGSGTKVNIRLPIDP